MSGDNPFRHSISRAELEARVGHEIGLSGWVEMDQAPETGYQETGRLEYRADDERWDDRADRDMIVKFADGNYGYVQVSMRMDGDFYVAFDGVWNPTGSAWLD